MGEIATNHTSRKATHLTANEYVLIFLCTVAYQITGLAHRYNWLNLSFLVSGPYLTHVGQVRDDLLSRIFCLPVPAEFGTAEVSCREMDEVRCTPFYGAPFSEATCV